MIPLSNVGFIFLTDTGVRSNRGKRVKPHLTCVFFFQQSGRIRGKCLQLSQSSSSRKKFHFRNLEVGLSLLLRGRQSDQWKTWRDLCQIMWQKLTCEAMTITKQGWADIPITRIIMICLSTIHQSCLQTFPPQKVFRPQLLGIADLWDRPYW